jgi:hypothetical protein
MSTAQNASPRSAPQFKRDRRYISRKNPLGYSGPGLVTQRLSKDDSCAWIVCPWCLGEDEMLDDGRPLEAQTQDAIDANMVAHRQCWFDHDFLVHDPTCNNPHNEPGRSPCKCFHAKHIPHRCGIECQPGHH